MAWESPKGRECWETRGKGGVNCFCAAPVSVLGEACSRACWEMVGWSGSEKMELEQEGEKGEGEKGEGREEEAGEGAPPLLGPVLGT